MVLYKTNQQIDEEKLKEVREVVKLLTKREDEWNVEQKKLLQENIRQRRHKLENQEKYTIKMLEDCKSWGGPVTSVSQLKEAIRTHPDQQVKLVKSELVYYRNTHKHEITANPDLFRINIPPEERAENLSILLLDNANISTSHSASAFDLPTESELLNVLSNSSEHRDEHITESSTSKLEVNDMCAVVWDIGGDTTWYLGYVSEVAEESFSVEHLVRVAHGDHTFWKHPNVKDLQDVDESQILPVRVEGAWDIESRNPKFVLLNSTEINNTYVATL